MGGGAVGRRVVAVDDDELLLGCDSSLALPRPPPHPRQAYWVTLLVSVLTGSNFLARVTHFENYTTGGWAGGGGGGGGRLLDGAHCLPQPPLPTHTAPLPPHTPPPAAAMFATSVAFTLGCIARLVRDVRAHLRSQARADWRAVLRFAWNSCFWLG